MDPLTLGLVALVGFYLILKGQTKNPSSFVPTSPITNPDPRLANTASGAPAVPNKGAPTPKTPEPSTAELAFKYGNAAVGAAKELPGAIGAVKGTAAAIQGLFGDFGVDGQTEGAPPLSPADFGLYYNAQAAATLAAQQSLNASYGGTHTAGDMGLDAAYTAQGQPLGIQAGAIPLEVMNAIPGTAIDPSSYESFIAQADAQEVAHQASLAALGASGYGAFVE